MPALFARYYPQEVREQRSALGLGEYDGSDFRELAADYRQQFTVLHQHIRTLGLPPETLREGDVHREIRLRDIFVPLSLIAEGDRKQTIAEVLVAGDSPVVLGDPGAGSFWKRGWERERALPAELSGPASGRLTAGLHGRCLYVRSSGNRPGDIGRFSASHGSQLAKRR